MEWESRVGGDKERNKIGSVCEVIGFYIERVEHGEKNKIKKY